MKLAMELYNGDSVKRPVKLSDAQKQLKEDIYKKSKCIPIVGRFKSCKALDCENLYDVNIYTTDTLAALLKEINEMTKTFYELNKERATEAVAFLVADLDRSWQKDQIRCAPVSWFPKGYSLTSDVMRQIAEHIQSECHNAGIHMPCSSFDGQWHTLVVRSVNGKPLTLLQLQKDVWHEVEKMKKGDIVNAVKHINKVPKWNFTWKQTMVDEGGPVLKHVIEVTNENLRLPKYRPVKRTQNVQEDEETISEPSKLVNSLPDSLTATEADEVLTIAVVEDTIEQEIFSCNVREEEWTNELVELEEYVQVPENPSQEDNVVEPVYHDTVRAELCKKHCDDTRNQNKLSCEDMKCILCLLKTTRDCNKRSKWDNLSAADLFDYFQSTESLNKFLDIELRVVVRYLKKTKGLLIKESLAKREKIRSIAVWLQIENNEKPEAVSVKASKKQVKKLVEIACNTLAKKVPKYELNVMYAEYIYPDRYREWIQSVAHITVNKQKYQWFYKPEYSEARQQFEVRCIDSTHLMTRARRKSCKGGLEGQSNENWLKVAKSGKTFLTPIMVQEITDPMSITMATTHFSEQVETVMRRNGDTCSADLCKDIRNWWESEDNPGVQAVDRHALRQGLQERLLRHVDFCIFPPATMYIGGWPLQLWEAIIASIDAKTWLYCLCHGGSYNVRAFSSMIGETFFAELTLNDKRGHGTVSCKEFGQFIGNTVEQIQIRLDPERTFCYSTCLATVYNYVNKAFPTTTEHETSCRVCLGPSNVLPDNISLRNHNFDTMERGRLAGRKKHTTVSMDRNSLQKGSLGVRWEKARTNLSKILPSDRMGLSSSKD